MFNTHEWGREIIIDLFRNIISFGKCVRVCGFIFFFHSHSHSSRLFLLYFLDRPLEKHICNFLVSIYSFSVCLSLFVSNLFSHPLSISNISLTFCLRISLICVGGCLVCVLIFFFYLLHLLLLAIFFS